MSNNATDPAEWNEASYEDHPIDKIEPSVPTDSREMYVIAVEVTARLLHFLNSAKDCRRAVHEVFFAIGKEHELGANMPQMAQRYGISKQAFSHGVEQTRKALHLPNLQRSEKARQHFKLTNYVSPGPRTLKAENAPDDIEEYDRQHMERMAAIE